MLRIELLECVEDGFIVRIVICMFCVVRNMLKFLMKVDFLISGVFERLIWIV